MSDTKQRIPQSLKRYGAQPMIAWLMAMHLGVGMAATPVIGTVAAQGAFQLDNSTVVGNATLFEGASVETHAASSSVELPGGVRVLLAPGSKGRFLRDRMILEKGEGRLEKTAGFGFEADGLMVRPETGDSSARVALAGGTRVQVAALSGSFRILNPQGLLVANLAAGRALEFEPQTEGGPSRLSGCLQKKGGHFILTDETTNALVELAGRGLSREANNRIEVVGTTDSTARPVVGASEVIRVTSLKRTGKGCASGAAAPAGSGGGAPRSGSGGTGGAGGGAAAGSGAGAHAISFAAIAVIGGVAAAATVGGLAAAGKLPDQGSSSASISR